MTTSLPVLDLALERRGVLGATSTGAVKLFGAVTPPVSNAFSSSSHALPGPPAAGITVVRSFTPSQALTLPSALALVMPPAFRPYPATSNSRWLPAEVRLPQFRQPLHHLRRRHDASSIWLQAWISDGLCPI
ncbi:hypothetical protein [Actinomadura rugatobispora]|uniref:Uncharacterized protein n=1 Tax=Actinomadura rugatobispora TaxID=1994 RepID=A0ABW1AHR2_9ACTN